MKTTINYKQFAIVREINTIRDEHFTFVPVKTSISDGQCAIARGKTTIMDERFTFVLMITSKN